MFVDGVAALGDDAFPAFFACTLPWLFIVKRSDAPQRSAKRQ